MSATNEKYEVIDCFCVWEDLLGYGKPFYMSNWDLSGEIAQKNIQRIKNLERKLKTVPVPIAEKILFLNDGLIRNVDVHKSGTYIEIYLMWLEYTIQMFREVNIADKKAGFYGVRGVLTAGNRTKYTDELLKLHDLAKTKNQQDDNIVVYSPSEFQMNTAFSKAYIMESLGKRQGLVGPYLFIDINFINYFVAMINESPLQELGKVIGYDNNEQPVIQVYMIDYSCVFEKSEGGYDLKIYVDNYGDKILYRRIMFSREIPVTKNDEEQNVMICTKLYKVDGLWSIEEAKYFTMDY